MTLPPFFLKPDHIAQHTLLFFFLPFLPCTYLSDGRCMHFGIFSAAKRFNSINAALHPLKIVVGESFCIAHSVNPP